MAKVMEFRVTLDDFKPKIWRTFTMRSDYPLILLHNMVQVTMGWEFAHLAEFEKKGERYSLPAPEGEGGGFFDAFDDSECMTDVLVEDLLTRKGSKIKYTYDFGDNWEHTVEVINSNTGDDPNTHQPRCTGGANACPPEDCGGVWGYADLLALSKKKGKLSPDEKEQLEWLGEFDPSEFDKDEVNGEIEEMMAELQEQGEEMMEQMSEVLPMLFPATDWWVSEGMGSVEFGTAPDSASSARVRDADGEIIWEAPAELKEFKDVLMAAEAFLRQHAEEAKGLGSSDFFSDN